MLMHRTPPRMPLPPRVNARAVKTAQTLKPGHGDAGLELLKTDGALGRVDTVLLGRRVREHARPAGRHGRQHVRPTAATSVTHSRRRAVSAVARDAAVDVCLAQRLKVGKGRRRKFTVADGAFVFLGNLRTRGEDVMGVAVEDCRGPRGGGRGACPVADVEHRSVLRSGPRVQMDRLRGRCGGPVVGRRRPPEDAAFVASRRWDRRAGR